MPIDKYLHCERSFELDLDLKSVDFNSTTWWAWLHHCIVRSGRFYVTSKSARPNNATGHSNNKGE